MRQPHHKYYYYGFHIWMVSFLWVVLETRYFQIQLGYHEWATTTPETVCDLIGFIGSKVGIVIFIVGAFKSNKNNRPPGGNPPDNLNYQ